MNVIYSQSGSNFPDELIFSVLHFQWDAERVTKLTASVNVFTKMIVLKDVSVWKWNLKGYLFVQNCVNQRKRKKTCSTGYKKNVTKDFFPGSHCFCNQATCVQGMFSFTINFIQTWKKLLTEIVNFWKKKP